MLGVQVNRLLPQARCRSVTRKVNKHDIEGFLEKLSLMVPLVVAPARTVNKDKGSSVLSDATPAGLVGNLFPVTLNKRHHTFSCGSEMSCGLVSPLGSR